MRAVFINAHERTVTEVEYSGDYKDIYKIIGCELFDVASDGTNSIYIDDEGLFKDDQAFFLWKGFNQPFAGNALVLSCDAEGETTACVTDTETIRESVVFGDPFELMALAESGVSE